MRVLIDTNVFISYLLTPHHTGSVSVIFDALAHWRFDLLLPQDLLAEIQQTVQNKKSLSQRIPEATLDEFMNLLRMFGEEIAKITEPIPPITRDPKDDYLIAYAIIGRADYLVTGDKDLLVLGAVDTVSIVTPVEFADLLA